MQQLPINSNLWKLCNMNTGEVNHLIEHEHEYQAQLKDINYMQAGVLWVAEKQQQMPVKHND